MNNKMTYRPIYSCRRLLLLAGVMVSIFPATAFADETHDKCLTNCDEKKSVPAGKIRENDSVAISMYFDNDFFTGNKKDEDYTGGLAVAFSGTDAAAHPFSIDKGLSFINNVTRATSLFEDSNLTLPSCEIGLVLFTPTNIDLKTAIPNDRPYASLIYIANTQQNLLLQQRKSWLSTLSLGAIGLPVARSIQNSIHSVIGSDPAEGWDNQISSGGELTVKYSLTQQNYHDTGHDNIQATTASGFSVGYITEMFYGASFRIGALRTPWWNFNVYTSNYGEKANINLPVSESLDEIYFFAGANVKLRAYNVFLQGQFRESAVSYGANEIERIVYETWIGGGYELSSGIRLNYILRQQSSEVKIGQSDRNFTYGELTTSYRF